MKSLLWQQKYYIIERVSVLVIPLAIVFYGAKVSGELELAIELTTFTAILSAIITLGRTEVLIRACAESAARGINSTETILKELIGRVFCSLPLLLAAFAIFHIVFGLGYILSASIVIYSCVGSVSLFGYLFNNMRFFAILAAIDIMTVFFVFGIGSRLGSPIQYYYIISSFLRVAFFSLSFSIVFEKSKIFDPLRYVMDAMPIFYQSFFKSTFFAWLGIVCNSLLSKIDTYLLSIVPDINSGTTFSYFAFRRSADIIFLAATTCLGFKFQELVNPNFLSKPKLKQWLINAYMFSILVFCAFQPLLIILYRKSLGGLPLVIVIVVEVSCLLSFWGSCKSVYYARFKLEKLNGILVLLSTMLYMALCVTIESKFAVVYAFFLSQLLLNLLLPVLLVDLDRQLIKNIISPKAYFNVLELARNKQLFKIAEG